MMVETSARSMADHLECLCTHMRFFLAQALRVADNDPDVVAELEDMAAQIAVALERILCADMQAQEPLGLSVEDLLDAFQPPAGGTGTG